MEELLRIDPLPPAVVGISTCDSWMSILGEGTVQNYLRPPYATDLPRSRIATPCTGYRNADAFSNTIPSCI